MTADEFETFDGAYVLGSLSSQDQELFEAHLEDCDACLHRVSGLWTLLDRLALAPESAFAGASADPVLDSGSGTGRPQGPGEPAGPRTGPGRTAAGLPAPPAAGPGPG